MVTATFIALLALALGYVFYWAQLSRLRFWRPFLGYEDYESLRGMAIFLFWVWIIGGGFVLAVIFDPFVNEPDRNLDKAIGISALLGIFSGYLHFRYIPKTTWEK